MKEGKNIDVLEHLIEEFGSIKPSRWKKKSSPVFWEMGRPYEWHWYEHPSYGNHKFKRKYLD